MVNTAWKEGKYLVELIKNFGEDSPLQQLHLPDCSLLEVECTELLKYLSEFRHLTHLSLNGNKVGKWGTYMVEMIDNLKSDLQLQSLDLRGCSIPSNMCGEILKCLKKCKQLTYLDLGEQSLEQEGIYLVDLIKNLGEDPPLQQLNLEDCSIPEVECTEMLEYISKYRHLTHLNLSGNKVGKGGMYIVQMMDNLGLDLQLKLLYVRNCSIPSNMCGEILKCLKQCKQLTYLDLGGQILEKEGKYLVELIKNSGEDSPLQQLYLPNCSISEVECTELLKYLSEFSHLTHLSLNGNGVGKGGKYIAQLIKNFHLNPPLKHLCLRNCSIPDDKYTKILKSLPYCKHLTTLDLCGTTLKNGGKAITEMIKNFGYEPRLKELSIANWALSTKE